MHMNTLRARTPTIVRALPAQESGRQEELIGDLPSDRDFRVMRDAYSRTGGIARGDDLARLLEDHRCGDFISLARLIDNAEIFGFDWHDIYWVPMFQFDLSDLSNRTSPQRVLAELSTVFDGWSLAVWFAQRNSWLQGQRPVDLLDTELDKVLQAASADRFIANG